jgi:hypothetical protein
MKLPINNDVMLCKTLVKFYMKSRVVIEIVVYSSHYRFNCVCFIDIFFYNTNCVIIRISLCP